MQKLDGLEKSLKAVWPDVTGADYFQKPVPHDWRCALASLVVQDQFGGDIVQADVILPDGKTVSHVWNRLPDGKEVDLTRDQFEEGAQFPIGEVFEREQILGHPVPSARYRHLKSLGF